VIIGENVNFQGSEQLLLDNGVEVINAKNQEIESILSNFIETHPELWHEDIGKIE